MMESSPGGPASLPSRTVGRSYLANSDSDGSRYAISPDCPFGVRDGSAERSHPCTEAKDQQVSLHVPLHASPGRL